MSQRNFGYNHWIIHRLQWPGMKKMDDKSVIWVGIGFDCLIRFNALCRRCWECADDTRLHSQLIQTVSDLGTNNSVPQHFASTRHVLNVAHWINECGEEGVKTSSFVTSLKLFSLWITNIRSWSGWLPQPTFILIVS